MSKPKRNSPCPCGSGKKYKKCCGANVIDLNYDVYNNELDRIHGELITYAFTNYKETITNQLNKYMPTNLDDDTREAYTSCLNVWTILNVPIENEGKTIAETFLASVKVEHTRTKDISQRWSTSAPVVVKIASIDQSQKYKVKVIDVLNGENYLLPLLQGEFTPGDFLTGILIPYVNHYNFFLTALEIDSHQEQHIRQVLERLSNQVGGLRQHYPDLLKEMLVEPSNQLDWHKQEHEEVAEMFLNHANEKGLDGKIATEGVRLWNLYCEKKNPNLKKASPYAAALDYFIQTALVHAEPTQKEIADEYGTSATTVSSNYRKLTDLLADEVRQ
ncbi:SEC-C metal-binding domain-containing protein [Aquibacillus salsiterrae]|uniref:SEC-C metal-binding domain-containing protein n=1 Tax=Aquibacillus salsiterrae TaxID=2950439 RepID=A0A9X3WDC0_9BACI|nr:SEC-C metal-binding domain-containing protein [Aquibacillus salsiterrae]MDC3415995.1 SEC-C metal-binding domain-containing protein [Aquibacillus salsiterrae]